MELTSLPELFSEKFNGRGMKLLRGVPFLIFDVLFDLVVAVFLFFFLLFFLMYFLFMREGGLPKNYSDEGGGAMRKKSEIVGGGSYNFQITLLQIPPAPPHKK